MKRLRVLLICFFIFLMAATTQAALVGYWAFDDATGITTTVDGSGGGNDGTLVNMEEGDWIPGVSGTALNFDGVNKHVLIPSLGAFTEISISMRIEETSGITREERPFTHDATAPYISFRYNRSAVNNRLYVYVFFDGTAAAIATDAYNLEERHHIVVTSKEGTGETILYVDGVQAGTDTGVGNFTTASGIINVIGANRDLIVNFTGLIDEVRIYDAVLTAPEVMALYIKHSIEKSISIYLGARPPFLMPGFY